MSNEVKNQQETPPDSGTPTVQPGPYEALALELLADLDAFAAKIPRFELPTDARLPLLRKNQAVPAPMLGSAIATVIDAPDLQKFTNLNSQDTLHLVNALGPVENKLTIITRGVHFTRALQRAIVASDARAIYKFAKAAADNQGSATLGQQVLLMRRDYGLAGKTKKRKEDGSKKTPQSTPPGTPPAPPADTKK